MPTIDRWSARNFEADYSKYLRQQLDRLRERGLEFSGPNFDGNPSNKEIWFCIEKPVGVPGNYILQSPFSSGIKNDDRKTDAPRLHLSTSNGDWIVSLRELVPGPGNGEFEHIHFHLETAIADILDYYFGDPIRMKSLWRAQLYG